MKDLNAMVAFVQVLNEGSFSGAAIRYKVPKSTLSRKVQELERELGVTLLQRSTRKLTLTRAGESFYKRCSKILAELDLVSQDLMVEQGEARGLVRLTAPVEIGASILAKILAQFHQKYPKVEVDVYLSDRMVDLANEGFDLALRAGKLKDSSLIAKKIGQEEFGLYASDAYLKSVVKILHPRELSQHACISFRSLDKKQSWQLENGKSKITVPIYPKLSSNSLFTVQELAEQGAGIALLPRFMCPKDATNNGSCLRRVLPEWHFARSSFHLVYPAQQFMPPKNRALIDFLHQQLSRIAW